MSFPAYPGAVLVPAANIVAKAAAYTAASGDIVIANSTAAAFVVTLPAVSLGGPVAIVKIDSVSANAVTAKTADGSTINGIAGTTGVALTVQYSSMTLVSDGTSWFIVAH